jgi:hypothetical protein
VVEGGPVLRMVNELADDISRRPVEQMEPSSEAGLQHVVQPLGRAGSHDHPNEGRRSRCMDAFRSTSL